MSKILLCGASGAGKGKAAEFLTKKYKLPAVATGDLVRAEIAKQSEVGRIIEECVGRGDFIPNDIALKMALDATKDMPQYVLDGYPRTLSQAEEFVTIHQETVVGDFIVFWLQASREICKKRMLSRGRPDDTEAVIEHRLDNYERDTVPCIEYLASVYPMFKVYGGGTVEETNERLETLMHELWLHFD